MSKKDAGWGSLTLGGILLMITSFISLYWALVGIERRSHGLDWVLLGLFGLIAFTFGIMGSIMAIRKKHFVLIMFAACFPLIQNTAVVKYLFDKHQLQIPWIAIISGLIISAVGACLIGRSNEEFV